MTTIKEYVLENFTKENMEDITKHGMVSGFGNLIYYSETNDWHDAHEAEIWDMLYEDAESQGITIMQFIASLNGQKNVGSMQQFKNLLCWYAVEQVCWQIVNQTEDN